MCLKGLEGTLCKKQNKLNLLLLNITAEHAQEILDLCCDDENEIQFKPHNDIGVTALESSCRDLRAVALDLGEEGAHIKIDPSISLVEEGFLKTPAYVRRSVPTGWELGNCLSIKR